MVEVKRQLLPVEHSDQFKQVGGGGKARQGEARRSGGGLAMVMAGIGMDCRRQKAQHQGQPQRGKERKELHGDHKN